MNFSLKQNFHPSRAKQYLITILKDRRKDSKTGERMTKRKKKSAPESQKVRKTARQGDREIKRHAIFYNDN